MTIKELMFSVRLATTAPSFRKQPNPKSVCSKNNTNQIVSGQGLESVDGWCQPLLEIDYPNFGGKPIFVLNTHGPTGRHGA
jgi:hypothetical protein